MSQHTFLMMSYHIFIINATSTLSHNLHMHAGKSQNMYKKDVIGIGLVYFGPITLLLKSESIKCLQEPFITVYEENKRVNVVVMDVKITQKTQSI